MSIPIDPLLSSTSNALSAASLDPSNPASPYYVATDPSTVDNSDSTTAVADNPSSQPTSGALATAAANSDAEQVTKSHRFHMKKAEASGGGASMSQQLLAQQILNEQIAQQQLNSANKSSGSTGPHLQK
jgi:hypothetical protein